LPGCEPDLPAANPYGINFTADAGVAWDVRDQNAIFDAAQHIATSLWQSLLAERQANAADYRRYGEQVDPLPTAKNLFHQVFGAVTFNRNAGNCDGNGCWAWSNRPVNGTIQVYVQTVGHGHYTALNAAHELGHIFDRRTGNDHASADLGATRIELDDGTLIAGGNPYQRTNLGYATAGFPWQQHSAAIPGGATPSEDFADMFLGWAYNHFANNAAGAARYNWMSTNMAEWITLASH
jgi:hypothetical protein